MDNVINSWKNKNVSKKQLELNLVELSTKYPSHWNAFISLVNQINPKNILDVGCGCGSYYELCSREFKDIKYTGIDYSEDAIKIAKKKWSYTGFIVKNYLSLTNDYIADFDLIHLGALLDVLPNGDEALDFILSLNAKNIIIGRMKLTEKTSYYETYTAYDEITTYAYYHNRENFIKQCDKHSYLITNIENNFYLKKKINE